MGQRTKVTLGLSDDEAGPGHTHPDRLGQMLAVWSVSPRPESLTCSAIAHCHGHRGHWPLLPPARNPPLCVPFPARCQPGGGGRRALAGLPGRGAAGSRDESEYISMLTRLEPSGRRHASSKSHAGSKAPLTLQARASRLLPACGGGWGVVVVRLLQPWSRARLPEAAGPLWGARGEAAGRGPEGMCWDLSPP